jgi:methylmalonyl-CoA/ethylmalonyl-CoA epimerase
MLGLPFHHLGIACDDIEATAQFVLRAFAVTSDSGTVEDPLQRASLRLFNAGSNGAIELIAGPMVHGIRRLRMTYYHVCYETPDLDATLTAARGLGALVVSRPVPAILFGGRRVAFVQTPLGLVEFLESACGRG